LYLIIDEVHVVDQWSTFRKEYGKLAHLRSRLPPSTRALGASATLDSATRAAVIEKGGFRDPVLINITTDRPEIYIEFRKSKSNFEDLHFLFPDKLTVEEAKQLPKMIVYFDSKQELRS
jgi:superfamily II DNA helicase RecQ